MEALLTILQSLLIILFAPMFTGMIRKLKAMAQQRQGCGTLQPYRDIAKLFRKDEVVSEDASYLFRLIPYVCLATMLTFALVIPFFFNKIAFPYIDLVTIVCLFSLARFMTILGGLEGGSPFGQMGSSRELMMSVLVEPALLLSMMALASIADVGTDVSGIPVAIHDLGLLAISPALILAASSFFITILAENCRIPFDNPSTHLELTMIHEGMCIEYSGRGLAMMEMATMIKLLVCSLIISTMFFPWGLSFTMGPLDLILGFITTVVKLLLIALAIALIESTLSKYRLFRLPNLLTASFTLSFLAMISIYIL